MADVAYPFGEPPEVSQTEIVRVLETALARARAGFVRGVMVATVETNGMPATAWWCDHGQELATLGAGKLTLDMMQASMFKAVR